MTPQVFHPEDGSILIEWTDKDYRFGISIEKNIDASSWYFVKRDADDGGESGELPRVLLNIIKDGLLG